MIGLYIWGFMFVVLAVCLLPWYVIPLSGLYGFIVFLLKNRRLL